MWRKQEGRSKAAEKRGMKLGDTDGKCWRACEALWRTCVYGDWDLSMVAIPRLVLHEFLGCLATQATSLYLHLFLEFVHYLSPFSFCYAFKVFKWGQNFFVNVNVAKETSSTHTLALCQSALTWWWWEETCGWQRKFTTREPSLCRHVCPHAHTHTHKHKHVTDCNDIINSLAWNRVHAFRFLANLIQGTVSDTWTHTHTHTLIISSLLGKAQYNAG